MEIGISKWKWVYYCLALLNIIAVGSSVIVNHNLGKQYNKTVEVNEFLAGRLKDIEQLQILASDINAPGNDIFDSKNVLQEQERYKIALQKYDTAYFITLNNLKEQSHDIHIGNSVKLYESISQKMDDMKAETELIFTYFSTHQKQLAARQMATMDQKYAAVRRAMFDCSQSLRDIQSEYLQKQKKDGEKLRYFEFLFSLFIILMVVGVLFYGSAMSKFITASFKEKKLAEEQKRALDAAAIVAITDTIGKITYANEKFVEVTGYSRDELLGENHRLINSNHHPKFFFKDLWKTISSGSIWRGEIKNKRKNGSHYWVDSTIVPMKNEKNEIFQYISIRHEITERKLLEESLTKAKEDALSAMRVKANFLANMSHEIRTPLNGLLGMATLLSDEDLSENGKRHLEIMKNSGNTLLTLINDILDFSKIEAGKMTLEQVSFDLEETVKELVALLHTKAKEKNLSIHIDFDSQMPRFISTDVTRLRQVLTNLLGNSIKFTPAGSITLKTSAKVLSESRYLIQFDVIDTGVGMTEEAQGALFQSFSQVDASTTRKYGGTGLGLAICKGITEAMGGSIWVKSTVGVGSTFSFTFQAEKAEPRTSQTQHSWNSEMAKNFPLKILVADDHATNQLMAQKFLEKIGYHADIVGNGLEVLSALKLKSYDVIFMDGHMPELDGYETTKKIHSLFGKENSPWIIAFSASTTKEDHDKCFACGMNDFVPKPFTIPLLAQSLERAIQKIGKNVA